SLINMEKLLTGQQLQSFKRDGFIVIRGLYSASEIAAVSRCIDEMASSATETGRQMAYFEDSLVDKGRKILSRIEKFVDYYPAMRDFVLAEKMLGRVSELLGEPAKLFKEKIN